MPEDDGFRRTIGDMRVYARNYTVSFRRGETLALIAELYQVGQPVRVLGCKTFADPGRPERLSTTLTMRDLTTTERPSNIRWKSRWAKSPSAQPESV